MNGSAPRAITDPHLNLYKSNARAEKAFGIIDEEEEDTDREQIDGIENEFECVRSKNNISRIGFE